MTPEWVGGLATCATAVITLGLGIAQITRTNRTGTQNDDRLLDLLDSHRESPASATTLAKLKVEIRSKFSTTIPPERLQFIVLRRAYPEGLRGLKAADSDLDLSDETGFSIKTNWWKNFRSRPDPWKLWTLWALMILLVVLTSVTGTLAVWILMQLNSSNAGLMIGGASACFGLTIGLYCLLYSTTKQLLVFKSIAVLLRL
ncbi:hypothetical protein [Salinicola halophyticus]|uniref:hypothetical protein n=1 Tax=Salinicola halophyticus TaxID=1808881 RepID=UPI003F450ACD